MDIGNPGRAQFFREGIARELGIVPRARDAADVDDALNAVGAKQLQKIGPGAIGMSDGEDLKRLFHGSFFAHLPHALFSAARAILGADYSGVQCGWLVKMPLT
jgi:hypothetical protein